MASDTILKNYHLDKCYIIAEIGGNFTNFDQAKRLIDAAAECGVDAVKLQTYRAETIASKRAIFDMENTGVTSQYDLFKKYEVDANLHQAVSDYIKNKNLDWFSTPSHESDVELLETLGVSAHKIGSDDATNLPFLKYVARTGKPIVLSTGMCTMQEVQEAVAAILEEGNDQIVLLHAITNYPTHAQYVNLAAMQTMIKEFNQFAVGYSDHTIGVTACICAAAMGARVVEKHFTYDKLADGPDHMISASPDEMVQIVKSIREFEIMKGNGIKRPADSEKATRLNNRKSIVLAKPIKAGEALTQEHMTIKRPGTGIPPKYRDQLAGRCVRTDMLEDMVLNWSDF